MVHFSIRLKPAVYTSCNVYFSSAVMVLPISDPARVGLCYTSYGPVDIEMEACRLCVTVRVTVLNQCVSELTG